jgi:hypothetical protein
MARLEWQFRRGADVAHAAELSRAPAVPDVDTTDLSALIRAFHGPDGPPPTATAARRAQLTISRCDADDFQDRQIYLFVDEEPWGKIRYGDALTQDVTPGPHRVRAFNTLFSRTLTINVTPGEHVRLRTGNGFPNAGYLLMMFLHVTSLRVRLEREPG